jgi:hypothetical protein
VAAVEVGSALVIDGAEHVVRELQVHVTPQRARTRVQLVDVVANRLWDAVAMIARQVQAERIWGLRRYRVFKMSVNRVELQVVDKTLGLPDVLPASMWPGLAGVWAKLRPGAVVLVEFVEGSAVRPIVTHYEPRDGAGFLPLELLLDAEELVSIGPSAAAIELAGPDGAAVHRVGDKSTGPVITALGPVITITNPDNSTIILTDTNGASAWSVAGTATPPGQMTAEAAEGSAKVTSE